MQKPKHCIKLEASDIKLIPHPKGDLVLKAAKISTEDAYAKVFPKDSSKDILYISLVSYTIGHINRNDCLILPEEGIATYQTSIKKPLNLEHEGQDIVGFCVNCFLSNIKNNKIISDDDAQAILDSKGLVNVGNVFAVWKLNNPETAQMLEENFDENSEYYNSVKASFEYYFNECDYFISDGTADYPNGKLVKGDAPEAEMMFASLKVNGGSGKWGGNRISIAPHDGFIGGVALTFKPANEFSDLTAKMDLNQLVVQVEQASDNKIDEKSVTKSTGENMPDPIKDTIIETKVVEATVSLPIDSDVAKVLQTQLDAKIKELGAKDVKISELEANVISIQESLNTIKSDAQKATDISSKLQERLDKEIEARKAVEAKEIERSQKELVASRMVKVGEFLDINSDNEEIIKKECAELSDEDFAQKLNLYKGISKKVVASADSNEVKDIKSTVETVVADTAKDTKSVNILVAAPSDTLVDKFQNAFGVKSFGFKDKRLAE